MRSRAIKPPWENTPARQELETKLRASGLTEFNTSQKSLKCPRCRYGTFNLYEDKARCQRCYFWLKLEGPNGKKFSEFKQKSNSEFIFVDKKDKAVICTSCNRHLFRIWADRIECAYEHLGIDFTPALKFYWPMEVVTPYVKGPRKIAPRKPKVAGPQHMSRSTIYRHLKKQKD